MITPEYVINTFQSFKDEIIAEVISVKTSLTKEIKELRFSRCERGSFESC